MKNQKGITLVALVVTIVVLLILAGVTIAMLTGDSGVITNAQAAKVQNKYAEVKDTMDLAYTTLRTQVIAKYSSDSGYDATKITAADVTPAVNEPLEHAKLVAQELGISEAKRKAMAIDASTKKATCTENGYTVTLDTTSAAAPTITMEYTDNDFKTGVTVNGNAMGVISATITLSTNNADYTTKPVSPIK